MVAALATFLNPPYPPFCELGKNRPSLLTPLQRGDIPLL